MPLIRRGRATFSRKGRRGDLGQLPLRRLGLGEVARPSLAFPRPVRGEGARRAGEGWGPAHRKFGDAASALKGSFSPCGEKKGGDAATERPIWTGAPGTMPNTMTISA